jgi:hypothetical protein
MKLLDQLRVIAGGLALVRFERVKDGLDAVNSPQDKRNGFGLDRHSVAEFADQAFGGVRQSLKPWKPEEPACALYGVNKPKDVTQDIPVIRFLLEANKFCIDPIETLIGLGQNLFEQVVHSGASSAHVLSAAGTDAPPPRTHEACGFAVRRQAPERDQCVG